MSREYYDRPQRNPGEGGGTLKEGEVGHVEQPDAAHRSNTPISEVGLDYLATPAVGGKDDVFSEEAKNQLAGGRKSTTESGKP